MPEPDPHADLPLDPDAATTGVVDRPVHLQPLLLAVVVLGGCLGTPLRYALARAFPTHSGGWPTGTFVCNLVGAFLLGVLLEALTRSGPDDGRRRLARLALGTGVLGAFTTYSTLAVETDLLTHDGHVGLAVAYAAATVIAGLLLTAAGIAVASGRRR